MTAAAPIDFYFDFSSPYGYIASALAEDFEKRVGRPLKWRPRARLSRSWGSSRSSMSP